MTDQLTSPAVDWEAETVGLLEELTLVQDDLITLLEDKRRRLADRNFDQSEQSTQAEHELCQRLSHCHQRREELLSAARQAGLPADSVQSLTAAVSAERRPALRRRASETAARMRLIQHHCITAWVVAQQSMLHVGRLLELIAHGGSARPTYGEKTAPVRGAMMDHQA